MGKKDRKTNVRPVVKKEFIEVQDGDLYLRIPKKKKLDSVIRVLVVLEKSFDEEKEKELELVRLPEPKEEEISVDVPQFDENIIRCPKCNRKLKSKVIKRGSELIRLVRCKKNKRFRKKCDFEHEFSIRV